MLKSIFKTLEFKNSACISNFYDPRSECSIDLCLHRNFNIVHTGNDRKIKTGDRSGNASDSKIETLIISNRLPLARFYRTGFYRKRMLYCIVFDGDSIYVKKSSLTSDHSGKINACKSRIAIRNYDHIGYRTLRKVRT